MALTPSEMIPLGSVASDFKLPNATDSQIYTLQEIKGEKATVIMFICNHCPYVKHVLPQLIELTKDYKDKGIAFIGINSNDAISYPEDSFESMKEEVLKHQIPFLYLYDESQETAKAYQAACTPDFYIFNNKLKLVYRGQLDDSRPGNKIPCTGNSIRNALTSILNNEPVSKLQRPGIGCNIKWK